MGHSDADSDNWKYDELCGQRESERSLGRMPRYQHKNTAGIGVHSYSRAIRPRVGGGDDVGFEDGDLVVVVAAAAADADAAVAGD